MLLISFQAPSELRLPLPMVTIIQSGRPAPGKLNCVKEFMIVPSPKLSLQKVEFIPY